ncbi:MAG TPA: gephyrin-like molybdotransferase Glp [Bryobacteraceae bacterium]|nr:gephyrin-like molybdotransferase Glp [Bryobacteraceae bacterium]
MQEPSPANRVLEFEEARRIIIETIRSLRIPLRTESIDLEYSHSRVLCEPVYADRDYPALRRSLRDGFAVRVSDVPGVLNVRGEVRAGQPQSEPLGAGEAIEVMTGAPVPEGADAVVMVEHVVRDSVQSSLGLRIKIDRTAEPGQFINEPGAEAANEAELIPLGTRIDASHIATLAMTGNTTVEVVKKPQVAILATGDEIIPIEQPPALHQIRNSNSYMLASLVRAAGGQPTVLPIAPDNPERLRDLLKWGLGYDMLLVSGGVSAGKFDLVKPALRDLGATFHFERVRVQPGQPTAFGTVARKAVFGLPGNPASSLITFELFAKPALELLSGLAEPFLPLLSATFEVPFRHKPGLTRFLPALLSADGQHLRHIPWQGSSDIPALARANAFLVADGNRESWAVGDSIRVMLKP